MFPKKSRSKIKITTPDKHFSKFIRLRDIVEGEYCMCITCGKPIHWKHEAQAGHFATRGKLPTRFNEKNCHAQCAQCNCFGAGEQAKHAIAIDEKYGDGTAKMLIDLSEIRGGQKVYTKISLKNISDEYRHKAKDMATQKGVEL